MKGLLQVRRQISYLVNVNIHGTLEGVTAEKLEELEQLYRSHAKVTGLIMKKWTQRSSNNIIIERYLVCLCEGKTHYALVNPEEDNNASKKIKIIKLELY